MSLSAPSVRDESGSLIATLTSMASIEKTGLKNPIPLRLGYLIAWILGLPASVLAIIFLIRRQLT